MYGLRIIHLAHPNATMLKASPPALTLSIYVAVRGSVSNTPHVCTHVQSGWEHGVNYGWDPGIQYIL